MKMTDALLLIASLSGITLLFRRHYVALREEERGVATPFEKHGKMNEGEAPSRTEATVTAEQKKDLNYGLINRTFRKADFHFARGEWEEAEKGFVKVLSLHEHHTEALNRLGVIYLEQNQLTKAELIFKKLLATPAKEPIYYSNYGRCLYALGKLEKAAVAYEQAISLDPTKPMRFMSLGHIYFELRRFEEALENFGKAYERDRRGLDALRRMAEIYEITADQEKLREILEKILELDPYNEATKKKLESLRIS